MPNLCETRMRVSGPARHLDAFVADCLPDGKLDCDRVIPRPAVLEGASEGAFDRMGGDAEIGIEVLTRTPWKRPFREAQSVLDREPVRAAGITSYDDLDAWARRERPQALELGRRCLQAFEATGHWTDTDWRIANWGTSYIDAFELVERTETTLEATFATPWSTADKVFHEMARRHPHVAIRIAVVEPGNEYSYLFTAADGLVREEEPGLTEAFMEEVRGVPNEVDEFYLRPATLRPRPLLHVRHWRDAWMLRRALAGYPVYEPPHAGIELLMGERQARANYEHFMSTRTARLEQLRRFLAPFRVPLAFSDAAKTALDAWIARYAAFLHVRETGSSYLTRNPPWHGPRTGLNVIFDLATFLGEFAIHESENLHWELHTDVPAGLRRQDESYQRPVIAGFLDRPRWRFHVLDEVHSICHALHERCYQWAKPRFHIGAGTHIGAETPLYTQFASRKLRYLHCMARGDAEGAARALRDA